MYSSTQDPHIKKKDTKFFKILKFGVYQAVRDTAIQKLKNLKGNDIQDNPYNYFKVSFFVRFWMVVSFSIQDWLTPNLSVVMLSMLFLILWVFMLILEGGGVGGTAMD